MYSINSLLNRPLEKRIKRKKSENTTRQKRLTFGTFRKSFSRFKINLNQVREKRESASRAKDSLNISETLCWSVKKKLWVGEARYRNTMGEICYTRNIVFLDRIS